MIFHFITHIFLYIFWHILQTFSSPLLIFLPHSLIYIPCITAHLFCFSPIYLQNWKFFSIFTKKWLKMFFLNWYFFSPYKCNSAGYYPNRWVEDALLFISKFFNEVLVTVFSTVICKKTKKITYFLSHFFFVFN